MAMMAESKVIPISSNKSLGVKDTFIGVGKIIRWRASKIKEGTGKQRRLVPYPEQADIIKFIFQSYLRNIPLYTIKEGAVSMRLTTRGRSIIQNILQNPLYAGNQNVKSFKELPGGIFPGNHEAIVDAESWNAVQLKIKKPENIE